MRYSAGRACCSSPTCFILVCRAIDHLFLSGNEMSTTNSLESRLWVCDVTRSISRVSGSCWAGRECSVGRAFPFHDKLDSYHYAYTQIGGGVLGDLFDAEERGKAIAMYSLAPLLGPALGPVCGAWLVSFRKTTFRMSY